MIAMNIYRNLYKAILVGLVGYSVTADAQIGYWSFENNANDVSLSGITSTAVNSPAYSLDNRVGVNSLALNGTNQYINLGNPSIFPDEDDVLSISVWAKTSTTSGVRTILSYGTNSTRHAVNLGQNGTTLVGGLLNNELTVPDFWTADVWHHIALVIKDDPADPTGTLSLVTLYADGQEVKSGAVTNDIVRQKAYIGRGINDSQYWSGLIDEVKIYDWELKDIEIANIHNKTSPLTAPSNVVILNVTPGSIKLNWTDNSPNESTFELERSLTSGSGYSNIYSGYPQTTDYDITEGTQYYYRVRAINSYGSTPYSSPISVYYQSPPTELRAYAASSSTIKLRWNDNSNNETGFKIERSASPGGTYTTVTTTPPNTMTFVDTGLTPSTTYYYRVQAVYSGGLSDICNTPIPSATTISTTQEQATQSAVDNWAFEYQYDNRKRMIKKKVPGADWVYMVYDDRDRLVMTQDGNQRAASPKEWTFTKYDVLNRPILTGIYKDTQNRELDVIQTAVNTFYQSNPFYEIAGSAVQGYTNQSFPSVSSEGDYLTVTYYDNYTVSNTWGSTYEYEDLDLTETVNNVTYDQPDDYFTRVIGQATAGKVKNLDDGSWLRSVSYYDDRYRVVQSIMDNPLGGIDKVTNLYDFVGKVLKTVTTHQKNTEPEKTIARRLEYDHAGRLMKTFHKFNNEPEVILAQNEYNELGQLITKKLHSENSGTDFKQNVDYRYNIRGWLTRINDADLNNNPDAGPRDYFGMNLLYNQQDATLNNATQFNGNISAIKWSNNLGLGNIQPTQRAYTYTYDPMNRLKTASHHEAVSTWSPTAAFEESISAYDLNGNIKALHRTTTAGNVMDELAYNYGENTSSHSNRLLGVSDTGDLTKGFKDGNLVGDDYFYDANGNMKQDKNKDITAITYNHLNLPATVTKSNGEYIKYIYDATGRKLSQEVYDAAQTLKKKSDYAGEFFYENDTLKFINHEEGRITMVTAEGTPETAYQYHLKDHLGNVRLTFTTKEETDAATATMETAHAAEEQSEFLNYAEVRKINSALFDHTNEGTTFNSVRLMGGNTTERYGLAKSLSVMPGDVISMEVYAKYLDNDPGNWSTALRNAIAAIAGTASPGGTFIDGAAIGNINGVFPYPDLLVRENDNGTGPKAYLNYIIFDRDANYIDAGFARLSAGAKEYGQGADQTNGIAHERLFFEDIVIKQPGYVYIYLSNENETPVEVFFDDFKVEHIKSPVVQVDDYYPFGLTFNSYQRENSVENRLLYNGIEKEIDLDLNTYNSFYRMHDPAIARWWGIDPKAHEMYSPYSAMGNNPILYSDPLGDTTWVYSMQGQLLDTINDKRKNQSHFIDEDKFSGMSQKEGESTKEYSKRVRGASTAFIGENTIKDMEIISGVSKAFALEFAFVGVIGKDREVRLQMLDRDNSNSINGIDNPSAQIDAKFTPEQQDGLLLFGHTHPPQAFEHNLGRSANLYSDQQKEWSLGTPTGGKGLNPVDYWDKLRDKRGFSRTSAAMILTTQGFSLYTTTHYPSPYVTQVSRHKYQRYKSK